MANLGGSAAFYSGTSMEKGIGKGIVKIMPE